MRVRRPNWLLFGMAIGLVTLLGAVYLFSSPEDEKLIRSRYEEMRMVFSSGDTNAARALFTPLYRGDAGEFRSRFTALGAYAKPLGWNSSIRIMGSNAIICPEQNFLLPRWPPQGHTIDMVKVGDEWFFTGEVHID